MLQKVEMILKKMESFSTIMKNMSLLIRNGIEEAL